MEQTLDQYLITKLNLVEDSQQFQAVYAATVRYAASGYNSIKEYHDELKQHVDFDQFEFTAPDFRIRLSAVCRFVLKLRFYVLTVCLSKNPKPAVKNYAEFGISKQEAVYAWNYLLKEPKNRKRIAQVAQNRHKDVSLDLVSAEELKRRIRETQPLFSQLTKVATYQARHKLRWVSVSHNITISDLAADLMCQVLVSYYQSLPNAFGELHQLNYLKASLSNRINNMNNHYGAKKRRRMEQSANGGYALVVVSDNQIRGNSNSDQAMTYENMSDSEGLHAHTEDMEKRMTIDRLLGVRRGSKRHALNHTLLGHHTVAFTSFLRKNELCKENESSVEWMARKNIKQTIKYLAQWLNVAEADVEQAVNTIRYAF